MFSTNCSNGSISTSCSFICTPNQSTSHPTNALSNTYHSYGSNVKLAIEVTTTSPEELTNRRYKDKCTRLQKQIRQLVFINKAIHSELNQCLDKLSKGTEERRFLLNKILHFQKDVNQETITSRILQEALSKKCTKQSAHWPSLDATASQLSQSIGTQCLSTLSTAHSSPKPQSDGSLSSHSDLQMSQSFATQTINSDSLSDVGHNKRIKLSDCHSIAKSF